VAAADADQAGVIELGGQGLSFLLFDLQPLSHARNRGIAVQAPSSLLSEGAAEVAGPKAQLHQPRWCLPDTKWLQLIPNAPQFAAKAAVMFTAV
jgi:hypothetical protein